MYRFSSMPSRLTNDWRDNLEEAKRLGQKTYLGRPCRHGHPGRRYVSHGRCADCGVEQSKSQGAEYRRSVPIKTMLWRAKARAKANDIEFTLTEADITIPDLCPILHTPMERPSLDRRDNELGYTPDNVRVISTKANNLKRDLTIPQLEAILAYMQAD